MNLHILLLPKSGVLFTLEVCFSSVSCCFVVSFAEQPDNSCRSLEICFALGFLNGETAENDDFLGLPVRFRAMGCPLVFHNMVRLSTNCFNLIRSKWVQYCSCFVSGACMSSMGWSFIVAGDQAEHCPPFPACTATDLAPLTSVPWAYFLFFMVSPYQLSEQPNSFYCPLCTP